MPTFNFKVTNTFKDNPDDPNDRGYNVHLTHKKNDGSEVPYPLLEPNGNYSKTITILEGESLIIYSELDTSPKSCAFKIPMEVNNAFGIFPFEIYLKNDEQKWIITNNTKGHRRPEGDPKNINVNVGDDNQ